MKNVILAVVASVSFMLSSGSYAAPSTGGEGRDVGGTFTGFDTPSVSVESRMAQPSVPTNLTGEVYSTTALELFWQRSTGDQLVVGYEVYRDNELVRVVEGNSFFEAELIPGTSYAYSVVAIDDRGNRSAESAQYSLTTRSDQSAPPTEILILSPSGVFAEVYGPNFVEVFWDRVADPRIRYRVEVNGDFVTETNGTSWLSSTLTSNTAYNLSIIAVDERGVLSEPTTVSVLTPGNGDIAPPPVNNPPTDPENPVLDAAALATLDSLNARSATFAISVDGQPLYAASYGELDDAATQMAMASLSKPVTAHIILRMQDDGFLSLDDPIGRYVPEIAELELGYLIFDKPIVDFLSHRSGLSHQLSYGFTDWRDRLTDVLSDGLISGHRYANDNYTLLTRVIMNTLGSYQAGLDTYINVNGISSFRIGSYHGIPSFAGAAELEASASDYFSFMATAAPRSVLQGSGFGYAWQHDGEDFRYHTGWHFGVAGGDRNAAAVWNATARSGASVSFVFFAIGSDTFGSVIRQLLSTL